MKITIDTKEDSHEEIRRVIKMLSSLVGEKEIMSNQDIFSDSSSSQEGGAFNMFSSSDSGSKPEVKAEPKKEEKEAVDFDIMGMEEYD
ncbi:hypothetical protein HYU50_03660 [Candidatus Woesearchaeota archaeon]|nr:hypothetical protein [Candidatus Woesearchaeota archaeon]